MSAVVHPSRPGPDRRPGGADGALGSLWPARVLVVDDEPALAELLRRTLVVAGFTARVARTCAAARTVADELDPEVAVLDVGLPDGSGFALCHELRRDRPGLAVVFLTARDGLEDRLTGLNLGGDDYVVKPFSVAELVARINAVLRRGRPQPDPLLVVADLVLDESAHLVQRAGVPVDLSPTEYRLLHLLMQQPGRVVSKERILAEVWQYESTDGGAVEKFVSQLRRKLDGPGEPLLQTVRGFGYVLRAASR